MTIDGTIDISGTIEGEISPQGEIAGELQQLQSIIGELTGPEPITGELSSVGEIGGALQETQNIKGKLTAPTERVVPSDYDKLYNKPIEMATTEEWNSQPGLIAKLGHLYFYTDYMKVADEDIAGVKIGDGTSYLIDLPFLDEPFQEHIKDQTIHVTQAEKEFWNNKNRAIVTGENLVLTNL